MRTQTFSSPAKISLHVTLQHSKTFPHLSTGMNSQYQQYSWQSAQPSNTPYAQPPLPIGHEAAMQNTRVSYSQMQEDSHVASSTTTTTATTTTTTTTTNEQTNSGARCSEHDRIPNYQQHGKQALQSSQCSGQSTFSQYQYPSLEQPQYQHFHHQQQPQQQQSQFPISEQSQYEPPQCQQVQQSQYQQTTASQTQQPLYDQQQPRQNEQYQHIQSQHQQSDQSLYQQTQYSQSQHQEAAHSQHEQHYHELTAHSSYQHPQYQQTQIQQNDQSQYQPTQYQQYQQGAQSQYQQSQFQSPAPRLHQRQLQSPSSPSQAVSQHYHQTAVQNTSAQPILSLPIVTQPGVHPTPNKSAQPIQPVLVGKPSPSKDSNKTLQSPPPTKSSSQKVTTTKQTTTKTSTESTTRKRYDGDDAGGKAREAAEKKGGKEVQCFEKKVQKLIRSIGVCPMNFPWYNMKFGYLCAEGIHYLYHRDIDMSFEKPGWLPQVTLVNTFDDPEFQTRGQLIRVHPPDVDHEQPMHRTHRVFCRKAVKDFAFASDNKTDPCFKAKCFKGAPGFDGAIIDDLARDRGFDPDSGRHGMFNEDVRFKR